MKDKSERGVVPWSMNLHVEHVREWLYKFIWVFLMLRNVLATTLNDGLLNILVWPPVCKWFYVLVQFLTPRRAHIVVKISQQIEYITQ